VTERLFGLETEYAFAVIGRDGQPLPTESILGHLMELARARLPCLSDAHSQGIFLANGARFYIDCGLHLEMTTPECTNPSDVVRYVLAGERILSRLAAELEASNPAIGEILLFKSNVDYSSLATWGCHESYLHRSDPRGLPPQIIPHLVSRIIYTGAGGFNTRVPQLEFTVSPRVWHLETEISGESTHHRGIFHTKDESLSTSGYHRLHILCGESLCSHMSMWLRTATTAAVVALIEGGVSPGSDVAIPSPLQAMQVFAADPECRARVRTTRGRSVSALDIQRHYLEQAEAHMRDSFMPPWAPELCRSWRETLDRIQQGAQAIATRLDWAIKRELYAQHARRHGVDWAELPGRTLIAVPANGARPAAALRHEFCEIDLRFGQLGEGKGIFDALDRAKVLDHRVPGVDNIEEAMENPPAKGRAKIRGQCIRRLAGERGRYVCSWHDICDPATGRRLDLQDPFASNEVWLDRPQPVAGPPGSSGEGLTDDDLSALLARHAETLAARRSWIRDRLASRRARAEATDSPDGFSVGDRVILGRHDPINGSDNWLPLMEQYVGRVAVIRRIAGLDRAGCHTVQVDIDRGRWMWRTRNLRPAPSETSPRT
jgi:hypothetical protein